MADEFQLTNYQTAVLFTFIAGLSTAIGGIIVVLYGKPNFTKLGHMLSFSAGVMLYISFMDLLLESIAHVGFLVANAWFFGGMAFFMVVVSLVPEPEIIQGHGHSHSISEPKSNKKDNNKDNNNNKNKDKDNNKNLNKKKADKEKKEDESYLLSLGFVTALGISLHNFPEGIAVYLACIKGLSIGLPLTVAIAAHNIPEGMAVATPIYHATGSKWQAFKYSLLSGLCEPIGALGVAFFFSDYLDEHLVHCLLAAVAGIMVLISIRELMPATFKYISAESAVLSNMAGMLLIMLSIHYLHGNLGGLHDHSHSHAPAAPVSANDHSHSHSHSHGHDHGHDHGHSHSHSHGHDHGHDHGHSHSHSHSHSH